MESAQVCRKLFQAIPRVERLVTPYMEVQSVIRNSLDKFRQAYAFDLDRMAPVSDLRLPLGDSSNGGSKVASFSWQNLDPVMDHVPRFYRSSVPRSALSLAGRATTSAASAFQFKSLSASLSSSLSSSATSSGNTLASKSAVSSVSSKGRLSQRLSKNRRNKSEKKLRQITIDDCMVAKKKTTQLHAMSFKKFQL